MSTEVPANSDAPPDDTDSADREGQGKDNPEKGNEQENGESLASTREDSLNSALVIDDDEDMCMLLSDRLEDFGYAKVDSAFDGGKAWELIQTQSYSFFVLDWKLPIYSGLALLHRIRKQDKTRWTPILIHSGLLEPSDFLLLKEFPCLSLATKPCTSETIQEKVLQLQQESEWYMRSGHFVDEIVTEMQTDQSRASTHVEKLFEDSPRPIPASLRIGKELLTKNSFDAAKIFFQRVLEAEPRNAVAITELARILHKCDQHDEAAKLLAAAAELSPKNIERLCLMGAVELNRQNYGGAKSFFTKALVIDKEDQAANAGIELSESCEGEVANISGLPKTFASMINMSAITMVRQGKFEIGIEKYKSGLAFISDPTKQSKLNFNIGLAYLRWKKPEESLRWFKEAAKSAGPEFRKPIEYCDRVEQTLGSSQTSDGVSIIEPADDSTDSLFEDVS